MSKAICFGEIMLRLNPVNFLRIKQANSFEASYAGGEANVAVSLANYGVEASFITRLPENDLSEAAIRSLKMNGVDTSGIVFGGDRLGVYYLEKGASQRPSKVIYDRKYSSISQSSIDDFKWERIFEGAQWFHFTGITPALGSNVACICTEAVKAAREMGITVSCDLNYRKNLWPPDQAFSVMDKIMPYVDVCIANEEDAEKVLNIKAENTDVEKARLNTDAYAEVARQIHSRYGCSNIAITMRESLSASDNYWSGLLYSGGEVYLSKRYLIHIVDRVGGGDSFSGALIYGLMNNWEARKVIDFAAAASCLKHTIEFDFNMVTASEVMSLVEGDESGRVRR